MKIDRKIIHFKSKIFSLYTKFDALNINGIKYAYILVSRNLYHKNCARVTMNFL